MSRVDRRPSSALSLAFIVGLFFSTAGRVSAQAWVPQSGHGAVTISFQRISNTGHILSDGYLLERNRSLNISLSFEIDYAVTDRLSFSFGLPYVSGSIRILFRPRGSSPFCPRTSVAAGNRVRRILG